ncbi:hypothetical protein GLOIN_2v1871662 [Rhizophagus irregularis DAOM 181602=DAOM 197198]|nr:hypothetical protein GLOIN_2v1871662 [Rhizophagus irregularis DAOM 181602=DAOM 197198]
MKLFLLRVQITAYLGENNPENESIGLVDTYKVKKRSLYGREFLLGSVRLWCRLAIPLLWENPFSIRTGNYDFIEIYLYNNLNNDFIGKLNEYKTINNSLEYTWFDSANRNSKFGIRTDVIEQNFRNYNYSNTLNTIIFYYVDFGVIINLDKVFEQLNVLESVHIVYCSSLNSFIQQINNLTKPFKLKSLILDDVQSLQQLLLKSGDYLENFGGSGIYYTNQVISQLLKYCNNINLLDMKNSDDILHYIKENIMKEKRVKYLAIKDNEKELFDLKDEEY